MLSPTEFLDVVRLAPLVSIDLIVVDASGRVLLGQRRNRPARGTWFVPGGRIRKGELLDAAFTRVVETELGIAGVARSAARFHGVFEHLYDDNFVAENGIGTHYVVLAYSLELDSTSPVGRFDQHSQYAWLTPEELLARDDVHENTKIYFR
ncbi:GDP-mannose mannosyl hydrolase [Paraburkholderia caballeronis]|uniref:Colanic acid biosynthesis protein WcaH n=1 Tax=Paraburkholderia caballeronis TaxID=416943 RepID=A0A1H7IAG1_9BURK|nr:GDP-mannose mannosyl hydrolase [Paraburkholderia caballeronis]PXW29171.1 colanic acid biosynthesis protein WcaH [Paraburkholderia caballeronis]PXX04430.1 colanic acid biosynthesis protein WcaH [Paraburkholderia caballeronis]RAK05491.1 colanic acid biosynthesis protein WcaH [Paraburkholderia caballeronis]TDV18267.1 colanic acid biosynthesis protein WcaH [Paraburkholderia caballeronis]TDV20195.1 colanic acid biosynthesis protein WcaH [Paraburkholderia caballeronis]